MQFDSKTIPPDLRHIMRNDFNLDYTPRPHYMKLKADSLGPAVLEFFRDESIELNPISEGSYFLDVRNISDSLSIEKWQMLSEIAYHIVALDLSETYLSDTVLSGLQMFENLVYLDLHSTNVSDSAMAVVRNLEHLKVLNVYDTPLNFQGLEVAAGAPSLERIYVWQTELKEGEEAQLRQRFPALTVTGGSNLSVKPDTVHNEDAGRE
jgi:hypothetical protein